MEIYNNKKECCGCTACKNVCPKHAITMKEDEEGFLYPEIDHEKCINCGLCKKVCPFQNRTSIEENLEKPIVYAAKNKNEQDRKRSSSGGMFLNLSDYVLKQNGVIYGAAFNDELRVEHIRAEDKENRDRCIGSKYSQSKLGDIFQKVKQDIENNKMVLFTGTPCQIAGLNKFLGNMNKEKLILVDIVCHGTPSPKLFNEYIKFIEKKRKKKIKGYFHRAKDFGWGVHLEKVLYEDGKEEFKSTLSQSWKTVFYTHFALRPSCYNCKFTNLDRPSDITIADFWGIKKFAPEFADKEGVSLFIVNTVKGKEVFENIRKNLDCIERSAHEATEGNPNLKTPSKMPENRKKFWEEYQKNGIEFILKKYGRYNAKEITKDYIKRVLRKMKLLGYK